jgi:pimeloyl-ACP methyl ester carboxylesterase
MILARAAAAGTDAGERSAAMGDEPDWQTATTPQLEIAYTDSGPRDAPAVILLHGFPYDHRSYAEVSPLLAGDGARVIVPVLRGFGRTRFRSAATMRSGQQAALGRDVIELMDALDIETAVLAGYDWGGRGACIAAALHPHRVLGLVTVDGYNIQNIARGNEPESAEAEKAKWYQHYFQTEAGRLGLERNRDDICGLLWRDWSPNWADASAQFARSAVSLHNPDFVEVVLHSYRHRRGAVEGDPRYDADERALAEQPAISVPTLALAPLADGLGESDPAEHADRFTGRFEVRPLPGIGHNPPQQDPHGFAAALRDMLRIAQSPAPPSERRSPAG